MGLRMEIGDGDCVWRDAVDGKLVFKVSIDIEYVSNFLHNKCKN